MALITSDRARFPNDPWQLVETVHVPGNAGTLETLFSLGNGHLGIRGAHWAARTASCRAASSTASTRPGTSSTRKTPTASPAPASGSSTFRTPTTSP